MDQTPHLDFWVHLEHYDWSLILFQRRFKSKASAAAAVISCLGSRVICVDSFDCYVVLRIEIDDCFRKDWHVEAGMEVEELLLSRSAMRIGHDDNFLCIEKLGQTPCPVWRLEATVRGAGWILAAIYDRVLVSASHEALEQIAGFAQLRLQCAEVELSEGGWILLKRDARGYILVQYRLGRLKTGAALEGEIVLEVEPARAFCHELLTLL